MSAAKSNLNRMRYGPLLIGNIQGSKPALRLLSDARWLRVEIHDGATDTDSRGAERCAEVLTLGKTTTQFTQQIELLFSLDSLCDDLETEAVGH